MAAPHRPPKTLVRTLEQVIRDIEPDWKRPMTGKETEFEFSNGRKFEASRANRHPYDVED